MLPAGSDSRKQCESVAIYSPDGEYLPLQAPVVTEGQPEEWLNSVEAAMFATTKAHLIKVLEDSKGEHIQQLELAIACLRVIVGPRGSH